MKLFLRHRSSRATAAFTMVEIAIAVAVIAFALVAIIGVLPAGLQVQKENRQDTLMAQYGTYFMEAIRNGSTGLDELARYVTSIEVRGPGFANTYSNFASGAEVIGLLSTPETTNTATVRAVAGALSEKATAMADFAFSYRLQTQITRFNPAQIERQEDTFPAKLWEVRLLFRWPVLPNKSLGNGRQLLRSLVSGGF